MIALAVALQLAVAPTPPEANVYNGRMNQLSVTLPKVAAEIRVDGNLDEDVWRQGALLTGFSQYAPVDGAAANDSTEVIVWYDDHAIYFGIRAFEAHGAVNATLADRDKYFNDDFVHILLDTFNDKRRAFIFGVNPLGVQGDGVLSENPSTSEDYTPDFLFQSKGRVTDFGYQVELRIPFKSVGYQPQRVQDWSIHVLRRVQHSGEDHSWVPAQRGLASFLGQAGTLRELTELKRGLVVDVNPVATAKLDGRRLPDSDFRYGNTTPEFGGNIRWGITTNLTMSGTVNPDFSQVEADASQTVFDPRQALFFAEKRPFFLESIEQFNAPNQLIYTRRIANPTAAIKLTGKYGNTNIGLLSAVDDAAMSLTGEDHPIYNVLRLRRDVGAQSTIGLAYTDKIDGDNFNRVASLDARLVFAREYSLFANVAGSFWDEGGQSSEVPLWDFALNKSGRSFGWNASIEGIHDRFVAGTGFISRPGIVHSNTGVRFTWFGQPEAKLQSYTFNPLVDNTWDYQEFEEGIGPDDIKLHLNNAFAFQNGWRANVNFFIETFRYPDALYANYYMLERQPGGDSSFVKFTGVRRISNYDVFLQLNTPRFSRWSAGGYVVLGRDENFDEWTPGWIMWGQVNGEYRPTDQLRASLSYIEQRTVRTSDRSVVNLQRIPRLKLEYQLSRPVFFRFVGQYVSFERDALRDAGRTELPIYVYNPTSDTYNRAAAVTRNSFRADWLFSYQPNPGTVIFAGYGSSMTDASSFDFRDVTRTADGFFVKLSYLFRL
ncbi:MAG TPA: DUF5916 domain-containing protein [Longimicrobiales bacterium]|nr:DUF5916 domain-containing protein [Longimicrobiales bacterium]